MSNVALVVGGRNYTVNCAAGEEDHITELGEMIDAKLAALGTAGQNESRNLLFAALLLADEVYELRTNDAPSPTSTVDDVPYATPDPLPYAAQDADALAIDPERLEAIASRLENLAAHLEG